MKDTIYFDTAATMPVKDEVLSAMLPYFQKDFYNPSARYNVAREIREKIDTCRNELLSLLHTDTRKYDLYFTSGGSESNSWAIQGLSNGYRNVVIVTTKLEHKSIDAAISASGEIVINTKPKTNGIISSNELKRNLEIARHYGSRLIVSIQFANNEIGTIQDIKTLAEITHEYGGVFHTDATQAFGKKEINIEEMGIDLLTASGHKIGAPKGIGFLCVKNMIDFQPIIYGSQNNNMRGGTENVPYIMGLQAAVNSLKLNKHKPFEMVQSRHYLISELTKIGCTINGVTDDYSQTLSNILSVTLPENVFGEAVVHLLASKGIYISTGSACDSLNNLPSRTLSAIGLNENEIRRTIRISFDYPTKEELQKFVCELKSVIKILSN